MKAILAGSFYCAKCKGSLYETEPNCDVLTHKRNDCEYADRKFARHIVELAEVTPAGYVWNSTGDGLDG